MVTLHSLYRLHQRKGKQIHAAFQGCFGQRFCCQDNLPLTKGLEVSDHTLSYTPSLKQTSQTPRKLQPQQTFRDDN